MKGGSNEKAWYEDVRNNAGCADSKNYTRTGFPSWEGSNNEKVIFRWTEHTSSRDSYDVKSDRTGPLLRKGSSRKKGAREK